ncbi:Acetolactate synthase large subunit [Paraburkholderia steynii]|uniref:Acetolactate synthase large subunit n=1 Tax=Paraburkholderia steynii TaxID=1245441 RepID=A0A7Z7B3X0_9BURK|nr:thiamine pyrophosphate-binding protein [Paraburkholderia steynii]SDH24830.1 Acetolactate synthase large subunit [Paraburkholderia steynii]
MSDVDRAAVRRDIPAPSEDSSVVWGSDAIAQMLRKLDIPYVLLNPGASFRGLHDSLVNYLGNQNPQMIVVLHEEHAIAIAHGYTKVTGQMLGAIVHSNVGLMHASMAIYNAWADRVPVLVLGATGPVDAALRRPWIDWLHTAQDQGALVRQFTKWDAQPASVPAAFEALLRAAQIARTAPNGPTYVCFDAALQETELSNEPVLPDPARYLPATSARPSEADLGKAVAWLAEASSPVILAGRVSRDEAAWRHRVGLAEALGARVLTDLKVGAAFPTDHPLHVAAPGFFLSPTAAAELRSADVVLSLDWVDLGGTLKQAWGEDAVGSRVIQVSVDQYIHNGWSMDHQGLAPVDLYMMSEPDPVVALLREALPKRASPVPVKVPPRENVSSSGESMSIASLAQSLRRTTAGHDVCLIRLPLGWSGDMWDFHHPLDYLGYDGGGGIGSGPGMAVGAALALKGSGRLPVAVIGDGDYMMGVTALWTAANARIPLLVIVANNCSFFNDELHQERVAKDRHRPVENRWIGQRIADPEPDLAMIARGQGLVGIGPVARAEDLDTALAQAVNALRDGRTVVVDVRVDPGYSPSMSSGMTRSKTE